MAVIGPRADSRRDTSARDRPPASDNQIDPWRSVTTLRCRLTPSARTSPSSGPNSRTLASVADADRNCARSALTTRSAVVTHSRPRPSSPSPAIAPASTGVGTTRRTRPCSTNASPALVPTQIAPELSCSNTVTSLAGNPCVVSRVRQPSLDLMLTPDGVPNQRLPSAASRIVVTVLEASPSATS